MNRRRLLTLAALLAVLGVLAAVVIPRLSVATDMSFFLPAEPPPPVAALTQGPEGAGSLLMIALDGPGPAALAEASDAVTAGLRTQPGFTLVRNGRPHLPGDLRDFIVENRYLLGPPPDPERLTVAGLRAAVEDGLARLATLPGWLFRDLFPRDPTGRLNDLLADLTRGTGPDRRHGVWMDGDSRALILARLAAPAGDLDAQAAARAAVATAAKPFAAAGITWAVSGPGMFALEASERIRGEMQVLSAAAGLLVAVLLLAAFRAPVMLILVGLPIGAGLLAGAAVTQAVFGHVHGVAVTFGAVLVGVAADYPIHLAGLRHAGEPPYAAARRLAAPLLLGAATTVAGLLALSQSSFPGLAQIGTLAAVAMLTAMLVSRWLLPLIMPARPIEPHGGARLWHGLRARPALRRRGRWLAGALMVAVPLIAVLAPTPTWETDLSRLGVANDARKALDRDLRTALGLPDTARLLLVSGATPQAVLERQAAVAAGLDRAVAAGRLGGYHAAVDLLPPATAQRERIDALPAPATLRARLTQALDGLPLEVETFQPFLDDIARHKSAAPLGPDAIAASPAAPLFLAPWPSGGRWIGSIALVPPVDLDGVALAGAELVDLRQVARAMVIDYRDEALLWLGFGALVGLAVLTAGLRSPRKVMRAALPAGGAVLLTGAALVALGIPLTLFHIIALLLVASVGVDYALFFTGYSGPEQDGARSLHSIAICSATTVSVFTVLAFSALPILSAIGVTVALGSALSFALTLFFSEI